MQFGGMSQATMGMGGGMNPGMGGGMNPGMGGGMNPGMGGGMNPGMGGGMNPMMMGQGGMNTMMMGQGGMNPMMMGTGVMNPMMMGVMNPFMAMGGVNPMAGVGGVMPTNQTQGGVTNIEDAQGWNLIFENQNHGQPVTIRINEQKLVKEAISMYLLKTGITDKCSFIFNNKTLFPEMKICQSGLNNLSRITVISTKNIIGAN